MTLYHAITDHNGNADGGPMTEIKLPAPSVTDAVHTGLSGFVGAVLLVIAILTILSGCALPLVGAAASGGAAAYSYSERDEISAQLIETTAKTSENAARLDALEEWAKTKGFKK